jgi:hypothetical protein
MTVRIIYDSALNASKKWVILLNCKPVAKRHLLTVSENFPFWAQGLLSLPGTTRE